MAEALDPNLVIKASSEIMVAFLSSNTIAPADLPDLVARVVSALGGDSTRDVPQADTVTGSAVVEPNVAPIVALTKRWDSPADGLVPAVPAADSVHDDYLISLEDGKHYRSLKRHLMSKYGMTPEDYRRKWGLPTDYPMVAPSYARERSEVAKRTGLGQAVVTREAGRRRR